MRPSGALTVLHRFSGPDGLSPVGGLTLGTDGNFYGTTTAGGTYSLGTIFRMTPAGTVTTLYSFKGQADGLDPEAPPIQGFDGSFYGTTADASSASGFGPVYRITSSGQFTVLHTFAGTDGANPYAPLVQGLKRSSPTTCFRRIAWGRDDFQDHYSRGIPGAVQL